MCVFKNFYHLQKSKNFFNNKGNVFFLIRIKLMSEHI